ncbi:MAG: FKBP-type peptidyl-prolyl cis-trans isomerase [Methanolinea sp.]|nr:FKBP-type peptidyl-prolyl cis-trans isomerase [Methanolinea sp.]
MERGWNKTQGTHREAALPFACIALALVLMLAVAASGCTAAEKTPARGAAPGDTVRVTYRMAFPGSAPFESNENATPLEFVLGSGVMIEGFDRAIVGMHPGETRTVLIPAELGYGPRDEKKVGVVSTPLLTRKLDELEQNGTFTKVEIPGVEGLILKYRLPDGKVVFYVFTNITAETTTVDQNHPLAGRDLEATITLVDIVKRA